MEQVEVVVVVGEEWDATVEVVVLEGLDVVRVAAEDEEEEDWDNTWPRGPIGRVSELKPHLLRVRISPWSPRPT